MMDQLTAFIEELKSDRKIGSFDEAKTKQAIILKLLPILGWDIFNVVEEVIPEYSVGEQKVDYSLRVGGTNKVFIEVKKVGERLENHQEQLLQYAFKEGVELAVLTNGITWWFYLPLHKGSWEQRRFYTIDITRQETEEITSKFIDFLSKENIRSGKAIQNAEAFYKETILKKVWNKIISDPDKELVKLINKIAKKFYGCKLKSDMIKDFIFRNKNSWLISPVPPIGPTPKTRKATKITPIPVNYTGKSVSAFYFKGIKYEVRSWKDMLLKLVNLLYKSHSKDFDKVLTLKGRKRPYFTYEANELRAPQKISNTDIFVETNLGARSIVKICYNLLAVFDYSPEDLRIEVH